MTDVKINLPQTYLNHVLELSGASVLIVVSGDKVRATAGPVGDHGVEVLVSALQQHWPVRMGRELVRYVGLPIDRDYRLLSARFFPEGDGLLGLVFPLGSSLCQIRQDLTKVLQDILDQGKTAKSPPDRLEQSLQFILKDYPAPDPDHVSRQVTPAVQTKNEKTTEPINDQALPEDQSGQVEFEPAGINDETGPLSDNNPVSDDEPVQGQEQGAEIDLGIEDIPWQPLENFIASDDQATADQGTDPSSEEERYESMVQTSAWQPLDDQGQEDDDLVSILQDDYESFQDLTPADDIVLPMEDLPDPDEVESPVPEGENERLFTGEAEVGEWEAVIADITFYLVPRLKRHFLVKELPHELRRWVPEICEIYGWQLDALSVRPDYLKWALRDFPESLIREMMRIIRRETSQRIFNEFPNLQHGNPTEDFWSQSYLVDRENLDISTQALIAHVAKDRLSGGKTA